MHWIYLLEALSACLCLAVIIMAFSMAGIKREIFSGRAENHRSLQAGLSELKSTLSDTAMQQDRRMEYLSDTVENRLNSIKNENAAQLEKMRRIVEEKLQNTLDERLARSFAQVRMSLDEVYKGLGEMHGLAQGVGDLKKVLSNVKSRGIIGEIQLGSILEQILAPDQYVYNAQVRPETRERVEYAVKMPGNGSDFVYLPIDAKFPGDVYASLQDAYERGDGEAAENFRKQLAAFIKNSAKTIREKYIEAPYTTDFAVMFLPFEGMYAEAVNMEMMEICQREYKVMIAGPSTMSALLNSLQMGFRTLAIQKRSAEVWKVLGAVKGEFDKFAQALEATQQRMSQINEDLDRLVGVRTRGIQKTLRELQKLGDPDEDMGNS